MAVMQDFPFHVSAKMLLIQASGNRPLLVARPVLAAEIRRALEPMAWLGNLRLRIPRRDRMPTKSARPTTLPRPRGSAGTLR